MKKKTAPVKRSTRRRNLPIDLSPAAQEIVAQTAKQFGLSKTLIVERLMQWFTAQDEMVRFSILGVMPESMRSDIARAAFEKMSKKI